MAAPQPIVDSRAWGALAALVGVAVLLIVWMPALAWLFGAILVYLVLRGVSMVLAAKASMSDPEARLAKSAKQEVHP